MPRSSSIAALVALTAFVMVGSCMLPFDDYDPRLGEPPTATGGSGTGGSAGNGGTNTGSGAMGGSAGSSGQAGTAGQGGTAGGTAGSGGTGGAPILTVEYAPTVADCVSPNNPDPDACEAKAGAGVMNVDLEDAGPGTPEHGFVRFDLDGTLSGRTVVSVTLELTVTDGVSANSSNSGEIWEVAPFTRADLFTAAPAQVGSTAISPSQGAVVQNQPVQWPLPTGQVAPSAPVYLGVFALVTNGVNYWNLNGTVPPRLIIEYQ